MLSPNQGTRKVDGATPAEQTLPCTACRYDLMVTARDNIQCKACHQLAHLKCSKISSAVKTAIKGIPLVFLCQTCKQGADSGDLNSRHVRSKYAELTTMITERERNVKEMKAQIENYVQERIQMQQQITNLNIKVKRKREEADSEDLQNLMGKMDRFVDDIKGSFNDPKTVVQAISDKSNQENSNMIENSKSTASARTPNKEQENVISKSYAQVMAENQINPDCILKIKLTLSSPEARSILMNRIKSDNLCEDAQTFDITVVGNDFLTIKTANIEDANKIKEAFTRKYRESIQFETISTFKPTVKISRLFTALRTPEEIKDQIVNQNKWIDVPNFKTVECYLTKVYTLPKSLWP